MSWKQFLSEWKWREWNEEDFLRIITEQEWQISNGRALLDMGAWAIISDIIRLYALYNEGGLYADWDVEFIKPIPKSFHNYELVLGFEPYTLQGRANYQVGMQCCLSNKHHILWKKIFRKIKSCLWTECFDILPGICTRILEQEYALPTPRNNNLYYHLKEQVTIVPTDMFYPFMGTRIFMENTTITKEHTHQSIQDIITDHITTNTLALHWEHSQMSDENQQKKGWTEYLTVLKTPYKK